MKILFFGISREITGQDSISLDGNVIRNSNIDNVASLIDHLKDLFPDLNRLNTFGISVNREYAKKEDIIKEGDEIALIPPVSGG